MFTSEFLTTDYPYLGKDQIDELLWLVILGGFVCFAMAWGIGANDVANAFSTSVGARAINLKQATVIAGIFEFVGAVGLGANVTSTVRKGIVDWNSFIGEEDILMLGMFSSLLSAAVWLALATKYSLPVSTTQSVVGAIAGFALCCKGSGAIHWVGQYEDGKLVEYNGVVFIALFWILTPVFSCAAAMLFFLPLRNFVLRRDDSYAFTLRIWPLFVFIVVFVMALFLLIKGLKRLDFDYEESLGLSFGITIGIACFVAFIAWAIFVRSGLVAKSVEKWVAEHDEDGHTHKSVRVSIGNSEDDDDEDPDAETQGQPHSKNDEVIEYIQSELKKPQLEEAQSGALISVVQGLLSEQNGADSPNEEEHRHEAGAEMTATNGANGHHAVNTHSVAIEHQKEIERKLSAQKETADLMAAQGSKKKHFMARSKAAATKGVNVDIHDDMTQLEMDIQNNAEKFDPKTDRAFAWLQVCTASLDIFAHGSNDVANAVAPFAAMISLWQYGEARDKVEVYEWILVIGALGMVLGLATYGYKIMKCLGVKMAPMTCPRGYSIELSSAIIVIIASNFGFPTSTTHAQVGATVGIGLIELNRPDSKLKLSQVVNWKLLAQVIFGWVLTLFISGLTSALIFSLMAYSPYAGGIESE